MKSLIGRAVRCAVLFLAVLFVPLICVADPSSKISPDLTDLDPHSLVNVIVQFVLPPSSQDFQAIDQLGGIPQDADLSLIRAKAYSIPAKALTGLAHKPNVVYISPDRTLSPTLDYANGTIGAQTAFANKWTGTGVGVAIIDSGILTGKDLANSSGASRIVY